MCKKTRNRAGSRGAGGGVDSVSKHDESTKVIRKIMPCWAWVQPLFDASSAPGCCAQSHEILLNKGMKYWDSGLNARGLRTFIATVHIAAAGAVIGWMRSVKERTGQTQLSTKFVPKLSFMPRWNPVYFFLLFFENLIPYATKQGLWVSCPVEAQCTFSFCVLKSHPLCDHTRGSGAIFSSLYATSETAWTTSQYAKTTRRND
jgi:hypothetical protein